MAKPLPAKALLSLQAIPYLGIKITDCSACDIVKPETLAVCNVQDFDNGKTKRIIMKIIATIIMLLAATDAFKQVVGTLAVHRSEKPSATAEPTEEQAEAAPGNKQTTGSYGIKLLGQLVLCQALI